MTKTAKRYLILLFLSLIAVFSVCSGGRVSALQAVAEDYRIAGYSGGDYFSLYLRPDHALHSSGSNTRGQLGLGSSGETKRLVPTHVMDNVAFAAVGKDDFAVAVTRSGAAYAWGSNTYGQLGQGTAFNDDTNNNFIPIPSEIALPGANGIQNVVCGARHVLLLDGEGNVWSWGSNSAGQLGRDLATGRKSVFGTPERMNAELFGGEKITGIACSEFASFALTESGRVYSWGENDYGQLGIGNSTTGLLQKTPVLIESLTDVRQISAFATNAMALTETGEAYIWGSNAMRQLGSTGITEAVKFTAVPVAVDEFYDLEGNRIDVEIESLACGGMTNFILDRDGYIYSFGHAGDGYVGFDVQQAGMEGAHPAMMVPGKVLAPTRIQFFEPVDLAAAKEAGADNSVLEALPVTNNPIDVRIERISNTIGTRTFVMDTEGNMWSWGSNKEAQICSGNTAIAWKPVQSTLFRKENYDKDIKQKNYLTKPLVTTLIILGLGAIGIAYLEIKNRKIYREEKRMRREVRREKKERKRSLKSTDTMKRSHI